MADAAAPCREVLSRTLATAGRMVWGDIFSARQVVLVLQRLGSGPSVRLLIRALAERLCRPGTSEVLHADPAVRADVQARFARTFQWACRNLERARQHDGLQVQPVQPTARSSDTLAPAQRVVSQAV